jgi:hypothetical protein
MQAVLISIQPKWCELIASGKKTVEVRKTKPKIETPFKVYIYCTKGKLKTDFITKSEKFGYLTGHESSFYNRAKEYDANGKVIGEFVCKGFTYIEAGYDTNENKHLYNTAFIEHQMCIPDNELFDYLYKSRENSGGWGWHISDLVIYDEPMELWKFHLTCNHKGDCVTCRHFDYFLDCHEGYCIRTTMDLTRPPQSWCYVEELR